MNSKESDLATSAPIPTSLRLSKALGLARQGNLKAAQQMLASPNALPATEVELHALAALVTHEGDYERALKLWRLLLQRQPGHPEARRMIPMIELWVSRPSWQRYVPMAAGVVGAGILAMVLLWIVNSTTAPASRPAASTSPVSAAAPVVSAPVPPAPASPSLSLAPMRAQPPPKGQRGR